MIRGYGFRARGVPPRSGMTKCKVRIEINGDGFLPKPPRKRKLEPKEYAKRFAAEKALQQGRYCEAFELWRVCALKSCRRNAACGGDANYCLKRAMSKVPHAVQWQARQMILATTPANLGAPERAARQCMPREFYV
jgi:hypothetical protein